MGEGLDYLIELIESAEYTAQHDHVDNLWQIARDAPRAIAFTDDEQWLEV